jgi:hypothetical protein
MTASLASLSPSISTERAVLIEAEIDIEYLYRRWVNYLRRNAKNLTRGERVRRARLYAGQGRSVPIV